MGNENAKIQMAQAAFERGVLAFSKGHYQETIKELTLCLSMEKKEHQYLDTDAYNMLGMLFAFLGYETTALDYYLSALKTAQDSENTNGEVSSLLNIGLLYQGCREYKKAMQYYKSAKEVAEEDMRSHDMLLLLYTSIQIAQLYCRMGDYREANRLYTEVDNYYRFVMKEQFLLPKVILELLLATKEQADEKIHMLAEKVIQQLQQEEQFIEQIDFYVDFCELVFKFGNPNDTQILLDLLFERVKDTDFYRLKMKIGQISTEYEKEYGTEHEYEEACMQYLMLHEEYQKAMRELQKENLKTVDGMRKLEEQRREYERRSRCDLATGLLNKKAFRHDVEKELLKYASATVNAMVFIDIDNFKLLNDSYGHLFGDEVICGLADCMKNYFQKDCICGRFGGDEFTVFIGKVEDIISLEEQIETFRETFLKTGFGKEGEVHATISIGVSYNRGMRVSFQSLLACADEALEKAKEYGKNRISLYEMKRGIHGYA